MKLYNPFRPHVVEFSNGKYAVRKLGFCGWEYFDNQSTCSREYWWCNLEFANHFLTGSLTHAQDLQHIACRKLIQIKVTRTHL